MSHSGWQSVLATRADLVEEPLVTQWAGRGWPMIVRRALPDDPPGLPLGLPLPPTPLRRRISLVFQPQDIVSIRMLPQLQEVLHAAPRVWLPTLYRLAALADQYTLDIRVSGSVAWQALTGLPYLTVRSDLDLLLYLRNSTDATQLTADLADIESVAPMRLDGELISEAGAATSWREIRSGAPVVLVKTATAVSLMEQRRFLTGDLPP